MPSTLIEKMKPSGVCCSSILLVCYLTITFVTESVQQKYTQQDGEAIAKDLTLYNCRGPLNADDGGLVQTKTSFSDIPRSAKSRVRVSGKRGNQFKNFMLSRDTSKDAASQVQKGSYIPVKANGKRDVLYPPTNVYDIYTGYNDMDLFQKWLSSYYLQ
ncbi:Hypothetical protein CINCED_3A013225 [Cinara cedri]|uniref:Uncharacterized protein n=1 Tax=Cinara cedri TaxID=506608 RepID=A0A5E4N966_9HEMI|nr:Hypothetical protein CINCED_3A013225 [Cinara cedri]